MRPDPPLRRLRVELAAIRPFRAALLAAPLLFALLATVGPAQAQTQTRLLTGRLVVTTDDDETPVAAPTGLSATPGSGEVRLRWLDPSNSDITKYQVRQGTGTTVTWGAWTDIASSSASTVGHDVTGLTNGTEYSFQVRAFIGTVAGMASATVTATPSVPAATVEFARSGFITFEGSAATVALTLSAAQSADVDLYLTASAPASQAATKGVDYAAGTVTAPSGATGTYKVTIAAGAIRGTTTIAITDDKIVEGLENFLLFIHEIAGDGIGLGETITGSVAIADNEIPGLTFAPTALTVPEGGSADYTVKLNAQPRGTVTVTVAGAGGDVTLDTNSGTPGNQNTLEFTATNWSTAQPVTVAAAQDNDAADDTATLAHSASGGGFGSVTGDLTVTVDDDDTASVTATQPADTEVAEGDASNTATFDMKLDTRPSGDVEVTVTAPDGLALDGPDSATAFTSAEDLTFTSANWNAAQRVTVRATSDNVDSPSARSLAVTYETTSTDTGYERLSGTAATVKVIDDDPTTVTLAGADGDVAEGAAKEFTITLNRGLVNGETLPVPLTFGGGATRRADYTLACESPLPNGVTCQNLNRGANPRLVTFTGPSTGATATEVTLTLSATADDTAEAGGETVDIGLGTLNASSGTGLDGGASGTDNLADFSITDPAPADTTAPTVSITGIPDKIKTTTALTATFTFSEAVTGFDANDVRVTGGVKGTFSETSATVYTLVVTPNDGANVVVTVRRNAATDGINTGPASAQSATATWDAVAPTVKISGIPGKIRTRANLTATFTFSEPVTGFDANDITVTGGDKGAFGGSGDEYTLAVTPDGDEDVTVTVAEDAASDGANDGPTAAAAATATWDDVAPTVEISDVPAKINSRTAFTAAFTFSEPVTGFGADDVAVAGGTKGAFAAPSAKMYTLAVMPDGDEDVTVTVAEDAASDGANDGPASAVAATAVWDASRPTVAIGGLPTRIVTRAPLTATFDFSEAVTGFDTNDVAVAGGAKGAFTATSATAYTLAVTPDGGGADVTVTVAAGAASDGVNTGPANDASAAAAWGWDVYFNSGTASVAEGPNAEASIALVLSSARAEATTVRVQYIGVTASAPGDYTNRPTSVVIPAGQTQADLLVPITDDDERESAETFIVRIVAGLLPADLRPGGTTSATVTINDDDSGAPASTGSAPAVAEAIPDQRAVVGRAFSYTFPDGTFTDDDDDTLSYTATRGDGAALPAWLTFTAASRVFSGTPEAADAGALTVLVTADDGNGNSAADEFNIEVEAAPATVALSVSGGGETAEGGAALTITATRSEANTSGSALIIPIQVKAAGTTAQAGDYTVAASISIANNDSAGAATFAAADDSADEPAETAVVELGALPAGNEAGDPSEVEITIADNDATSVTLAGADGDVVEGRTKTFTITLNRGLVDGEALAVPLTFGGSATRGADYATACPSTPPAGVACANLDSGDAAVTFTGPSSGATATSVTLTLTAAADGAAESGGETVAISLGALDANSGTNLGGGAAGADSLEDFSITDPVPAGVTTAQPADTEVAEGDATDTATFTVALDSQPSSGVTVTVAAPAGLELDGPDSSAAFTSSEPLAFTADNWSMAQTVTVRATEDNADSPSGRELDVTYSTASPDSAYSGLTGTAATVTAADNDPTPVTLAGAPGDVAEGGAKTFTVTLGRGLVDGEALAVPLTFGGAATRGADYSTACPSTPPAGVACANLDSGDAAVTFTGPASGATATSVTLTLTAAADGAAEGGGETVAISLGALDANSGTNLEGGASGADNLADFLITDPPATDTVAPAVEISGIPAKINSAAALTATFTFSEAVTGFDADDVTVAGGAKGAFTATSAAVYTLAVTPDGGADVTVTVAANAATDGTNTGPTSAAATTAAWDASAPTVEISGIPARINSTGVLTATFTFSEDVTGFDADDVAVAGGTKGVFTAAGAAVYTLAVMPNGDADVIVTVAADAATDGVNTGPSSAVTATAAWGADAAPAVVVSGSPVSLVEGGASGSYTVALATDPGGAVTVTPSSGDAGAVTVSGPLTFNADNWSRPQTVAVSAADDDDSADETVTIRHAVSGYPGVASAPAATVAVADDDEPSLAVSESSLSLEEGAGATYTVALGAEPPGPVAVAVSVSDGAGVSASPSSLTFTADDWNAPRTVTVAALEDDDIADESGSITHAASGGGYGGVSAEVAVMVADDDEPSLIVSESSLSLDEGGGATYTVALGAAPAGAVTVSVSVSEGAGVSVSPASLAFTADDWSMPRTVAVAALEDDDIADESGSITHAASGGGYGGVSAEVAVMVSDDDEPSLIVSESSLSIDEGAGATYTVALGAAPSGAVTVSVSVSEGAGVSVSPASLAFTADDWSMPRTVAVAALEDDDIADESGSITHAASGGGYGGVSAEVRVSVADDDEPSLIVSQSSLSIDEGAGATYTVALGAAPSGPVSVSVAVSEGAGVEASPSSLMFTADDWSMPRTVAVSALEDDDIADESGSITHAASGGGYGGVSAEVRVSVSDNDEPSAAAAAGAWMPRFGRAAAEQILEGVGGRVASLRGRAARRAEDAGNGDGGAGFEAALAGGPPGGGPASAPPGGGAAPRGPSGARPFPASGAGGYPGGAGAPLAGPPSPAAGAGARGERPSGGLLRAALAGSSFSAGGSSWGLWGRGSLASFEGRAAGGAAVDGDVATGQAGADWSSGLWLFGISASHSRGDGDYSDDAGGGSMESSMTALTPYASMDAGRFSAWGAFSAGSGDMKLMPEGGAAVEAGIDLRMGAAGLRGDLADLGGGWRLSLAADAMAARFASEEAPGLPEAESRASRFRAAVEASWTRALAGGGEFSARLEGGARHDGGDAEEGWGAEVSAGLSWARGGLAFGIKGRHLAAHEDGGFSRTGVSARLDWDCGPGGLGPSASLRRRWGAAEAVGAERLLSAPRMGQFGAEPDAGGLKAELGWGLALPGGRLLATPFLLRGTRPGGGAQTLGWRLERLTPDGAAPGAGMAVKLTRRADAAGGGERGILVEARLGF